MNKYFLTFKDNNLETQYQKSLTLYNRQIAFKFVNYGLFAVGALKIYETVTKGEIRSAIYLAFLLFYIILQLVVVQKNQQYLRMALVFSNHFIHVYYIIQGPPKDQVMAMFQGMNCMALTFILVLNGENMDGVLTMISLLIFRVAWASFVSLELNWSILISQLILLIYIVFFNYQFHNGRRSQFLLTLVEQNWKNIFNKLAMIQPFILLQYKEDNLHFSVEQESNCDRIYMDNEGCDHFLKNSTINNKKLQYVLQRQLTQFYERGDEKQEEIQIIRYNKKTIKVEIFIYNGKKPNILLLFRDFKENFNFNSQYFFNRTSQLTKLLIKTLNKLTILSQKNPQYLTVLRKMSIVYLFEKIQTEYQEKSISNQKLKHILSKSCLGSPHKIQLDEKVNMMTMPKLLSLFFFIIFDNITHNEISLTVCYSNAENITIEFRGEFNKNNIVKVLKPISYRLQIIFTDIQIDETHIKVNHPSKINLPFQIIS